MRLLRPLLPLLLAVPLLSACSGDADEPAGFRPPAASALAGGGCALVAGDVVAVGRAAHDLEGKATPDPAVRDSLSDAQDRLSAFAETAGPGVKPALDRLVVATGLVRLRLDTKQADPDAVAGMQSAYDEAVAACSGSASPAAS